jgi:glycosyltransferase involved in cell wall biosynthesis
VSTPEVSIIIPVWNGERHVQAAMRSVLRETNVDLELIVVDDGSTDGTVALVAGEAARDPRIRLITCPHRGVAPARNSGLAAARAPFITFVDSDDISVGGRLRRQADYLLGHADVSLVYGDILLVKQIGDDLAPVPGSPTIRDRLFSLTVAMVRRSVFDRHGAFDETLHYGEDVDFFFRIWEVEEPMHFDDELAILYRRHDTNMTNNHDEVRRWMLVCLQRSLARRRLTGARINIPEAMLRRGKVEAAFGQA